jgi:cyclin A
MQSMLENAGVAIPQKERDLLVRDCCAAFKAEGFVDEFLEWMAAHERVSSLTTSLHQTGVGSPRSPTVASAVGNLYAEEIHDNLLAREDRFSITPEYMETVQRDITHNMRSILVDWLVEVGEEYKLTSQTLFLAVNYVDRLLGIRSINRNKLQLLGITCMLVAAKYEEIYPPTIDELVYISDNTYTRKDVVTMESILLTSLQFHLSAPTSWEFARGFCSSASIGDRPKFLAHFLAELFMMFPCSLKYRPSVVAASSVFLALYMLHLPPWPAGLLELAGNKRDLLQQCVEDLHSVHKKVLSGGPLKAIREKFQESKWLKVSLIPSRSLTM